MNRVEFLALIAIGMCFCCFSSCSEQRIVSILGKKIEYYDDFYKENDEDLKIELNRLSKSKRASKEYNIIRLKDNAFAAIQTYPNKYLIINFKENPIDTGFVTTFGKIDCLTLIREGNNVYIENKIRDSIYILFKGEILRDGDFAEKTSIKYLRDDWYYFSYLFDPAVDRKRNRYRRY